MTAVWFGSNNFLHGVLILPMSAYLVWRMRDQWVAETATPSVLGGFLLAACVSAWTIASLVAVQLVAQLAFIGMIATVVWSLFGTRIAQILHFPLLYAFFAVPFGEFLIPVLMDWTAYATVRALQVTGIPVLRDGHYFSLPSGNFEVIEACSGIRFLIVTVVLGIYFAHETYRSWSRRIVFVAVAALAIIVANWLRAYLVVLIAHLTEMRYGTGQDHIYVGWAIFLVVITVLFWIGRRYEDVHGQAPDAAELQTIATAGPGRGRVTDTVVTAVIVLVLLASGPILLDAGRERMSGSLPQPSLPLARDGWSGPRGVSLGYRPAFRGASDTVAGQYLNASQAIELHIVFYTEQQQGNELVGWQSKLFDADEWRRVRSGRVTVSVPGTGEQLSVRSLLLENGAQLLQLWYWYDIGGALTSGPRTAKVRQAWNAISGNSLGDALVVVVMPVDYLDTTVDAEPPRAFVIDHLDNLKLCLRAAAGNSRKCSVRSVQRRIQGQ